MIKSVSAISITSILLCSLAIMFTDAQSMPNFAAEGVVVAFQKGARCPSCEGAKGVGIVVENWIVRVDKWEDEKFNGSKYILVHYEIYNRSPSDSEINKKLKFILRERKEHEQTTDCIGAITYKEDEEYFSRPAELKDYKRTEAGESDQLDDFKQFPCFIVEKLPKVVGEDSKLRAIIQHR